MEEDMLRISLENPTVESLTQALYKVIDAYKQLAEKHKKIEAKCAKLERENERLRRQINNNSKNSSKPPSSDQKPSKPPSADQKASKAANTYNSREKSGRKKGAQKGHAGKNLAKESVRELIDSGKAVHRIVGVGMKSATYETRYVVDMETRPVVTEIRFYHGRYGKARIPSHLSSPVTYGAGVRSICTMLYSEGVVSNDRIQTIVHSLSGNLLSVSAGSVYHFCKSFVASSAPKYDSIKAGLIAEPVVGTDATTVSINGVQKYIRNFSTDTACLYEPQGAKSIACMKESAVLPKYSGTLVHDHETALFHFGEAHGECNAHIFRYLNKNSEESGNSWSSQMKSLLSSANKKRREAIAAGEESFSEAVIADIEAKYDALLSLGDEQSQKTKGYTARKEERSLLRRLRKYQENILLFLRDFHVPFTNNMSERDLRKCKNRQKMAGGFRDAEGCDTYCKIMSVVETWKREGKNLLNEIRNSFETSLAIPHCVPVYL